MPVKKRTKSNAKSKKGGKKGGVSVMATGTGLAVGAALGAAAGALLADENRRSKIVAKAGALSHQAVDVLENVADDTYKLRDKAYESLEGAKEDAQDKTEKTRKTIRKS